MQSAVFAHNLPLFAGLRSKPARRGASPRGSFGKGRFGANGGSQHGKDDPTSAAAGCNTAENANGSRLGAEFHILPFAPTPQSGSKTAIYGQELISWRLDYRHLDGVKRLGVPRLRDWPAEGEFWPTCDQRRWSCQSRGTV